MIRPVGRLCLALSLAALLAGGVLPVIAAAPAPEPASKERVDYLEKRLDELKAEQRDLQQLLLREMDRVGVETDKSIAAQDKRIADLQWAIAIILTLLGVGGSLLGYKVVSSKVKEAEDATAEAKKFATQAKEHLDAIRDNRNVSDELLDQQKRSQQTSPSASIEGATPVPPPTDSSLERQIDSAAKNIVSKDGREVPESRYSAADLSLLGFNAFNKLKYAEAVTWFEKAAQNQNGTKLQIASATLWAGHSYFRLTAFQKAIECYDEVLRLTDGADEPALREAAAIALLDKGEGYRMLNDLNKAKQYYSKLIEDMKDAGEGQIREQVGNAYNNRAITELTTIKQSWESLRPEGREPLIKMALSDLEQALVIFGGLHLTNSIAVAKGNKGYLEFLNSRKQNAEANLREALNTGGEAHYQAKIKDANFHPIPVIDDEFKAMVNRLWDEINPKK